MMKLKNITKTESIIAVDAINLTSSYNYDIIYLKARLGTDERNLEVKPTGCLCLATAAAIAFILRKENFGG